MRIVTENYTLYPNLLPGQVPIKMNADYNVTETCKDQHKFVRLSITFNTNVLENLEYVICKVFNESDNTVMYPPSRVDITQTFTSEPTTMTIHDSSSTASMETMTASGCSLSLHLASLVVGIIVHANSVTVSWI